jgi:predicted phage-related endonuclease
VAGWRREGVGASDAPIMLGGSRYRTARMPKVDHAQAKNS